MRIKQTLQTLAINSASVLLRSLDRRSSHIPARLRFSNIVAVAGSKIAIPVEAWKRVSVNVLEEASGATIGLCNSYISQGLLSSGPRPGAELLK